MLAPKPPTPVRCSLRDLFVNDSRRSTIPKTAMDLSPYRPANKIAPRCRVRLVLRHLLNKLRPYTQAWCYWMSEEPRQHLKA